MKRSVLIALIAVPGLLSACASSVPRREKTCAVYTSILDFASPEVMRKAAATRPTTQVAFLMEKHRKYLAGMQNAQQSVIAQQAGFNTVFMTLYPLHGHDWWANPAAKAIVTDAAARAREKFRVHLGLSIFNAPMCEKPGRYAGALRTIQCDGTRPDWVCFFDDALWDYYIKNAVELAKVPNIDGVFIDPEAYGPECYLCFCDNCVRKFNAYSGERMPTGLVKPDSWLLARGLWNRYTRDWHDQEVLRHAVALRKAVHAINPNLQLSSLLWDYPVAVGINDARQQYFRMLAIGLGTKERPSWTMPEHTYYSDGADLERIIGQVYSDIEAAGAKGQVEVLPGIRILRRPASSLAERGEVIARTAAPGYWLYELDDLGNKKPIDFEGALLDPAAEYISALRAMNGAIQR